MRYVFIAALLTTLCGCSTTDRFKMYDGMQRASFDLDCPESELALTPLGANQMGVEGCGKKAAYVATESGWVLNSESSRSE